MPNPLEPLRLLAAKVSLGIIHSWEIPPIADRLLADGVYSDSLAELAAVYAPEWGTVAPLVQRAVVELRLPVLSRADAAWYLADHCIRRALSDNERPVVPLSLLKDVCYASKDALPDGEYLGAGLDIGHLISIFWSYSEPTENYYVPEKRLITDEAERQSLLDRLAREECMFWLQRHPSVTETIFSARIPPS